MESHPVELRAELHELQPFSCIPAILLSCVTRHAWRTLVGGGPAFGALESDHNPDALVLSHKDVAPQVRDEVTASKLTFLTVRLWTMPTVLSAGWGLRRIPSPLRRLDASFSLLASGSRSGGGAR